MLFETNNCIISYLKNFVVIFIIVIFPITLFGDDDNAKPAWMNKTMEGLSTLNKDCLTVPNFGNFYTANATLPIGSNEWIATGTEVSKGKEIKIAWNITGIEHQPKKYLVLFRIDPRFERSQVFIQQYDSAKRIYVSDFHKFRNGILNKYQNDSSSMIYPFKTRLQDYIDYFQFKDRPRIHVSTGDIVNITLISSSEFFVGNGDFTTGELAYPYYPISVIYTETGLWDNVIMNPSADTWCKGIEDSKSKSYDAKFCSNHSYSYSVFSDKNLLGILPVEFPDVIVNTNNGYFKECPTVNIQDPKPLCYYSDGRGMKITSIGGGGSILKQSNKSFISSDINMHKFFYYKADAPFDLDFEFDWNIEGEFTRFPQFMTNWISNNFTDERAIANNIRASMYDLSRKKFHVGRYFLNIEIGNGEVQVSDEDSKKIKVEYFVVPKGTTTAASTPSSTTNGIALDYEQVVVSDYDGYLWFRVQKQPADVDGSINVEYSTYLGSTNFSEIVYVKIIKSIQEKLFNVTENFYNGLIKNAEMHKLSLALLVLYITIYAIWFTLGSVQITANDLAIRLFKVAVVATVFTDTVSWKFFNENLFGYFTDGIAYLFGQIGGAATSKNGGLDTNIFTFLDPLFDKYINPRMWGLLGIQLLQFHNGLTIFAGLSIYALIKFFKTIIQVVVTYVISIVGLSIMISIAPLFFLLILFERSRSIFDNWLSVLFDYMIRPSILLVFFLFIDQIITTQIGNIVVPACWGKYIDLTIRVNLGHSGMKDTFEFSLPFLPYISFWMSKVADVSNIHDIYTTPGTFIHIFTSSLLFYILCVITEGLLAYSNSISQSLTNVSTGQGEATNAVVSNMTSVVKPIAMAPIKAAKSVASVLKDKTIDQNFRAKPGGAAGEKPTSYANKIKSNRHDVNENVPNTNSPNSRSDSGSTSNNGGNNDNTND